MRFFRITKISRKGVLSNNLSWTGPQSCPNISQYPDCNKYYKKQNYFLKHIICTGRNVSLFPPLQSSIAVEAACVLPLFLFFCIQIISIISILQLHSALEAALHQEITQASLEAYAYETIGAETDSEVFIFLEQAYLRSKVIERAGREYLDHSVIEGGSSGIHLVYEGQEDAQDMVNLILSYKVRPLIDLLGFSEFTMANSCQMKAWTGYRLEYDGQENEEEELVFVTETGTVYHKNRNCTHLVLSIRSVNTDSLGVLRNDSGEKYYPCENCGKHPTGSVYLTDQGNRYHTNLQCNGLKRTIYTIPISETGGRRPCSRCSAMG